MAVITVVATAQMGRMLAGRSDSIVTASAAAEDLCVIDRIGRGEGDRVVAVLTHVGGLYVRRILAGCIGAVVAGRATASDIDVVKIGWNPCGAVVTVIAIVATGNVVRVFAGRDNAVVA